MEQYKVKSFSIPKIKDISEKAIEVHLGLYEGYVNNLNSHYEALKNCDGDPLVLSALTRRIGFELAGIKNHELYFETLEGGANPLNENSDLSNTIKKEFGSQESFINCIKHKASIMRGIGWVIVVYDINNDQIHMLWVTDHELGNVNLPAIIALDMWEHSYMVDYMPADKGKYIDAYINAINWEKVSEIFSNFKK